MLSEIATHMIFMTTGGWGLDGGNLPWKRLYNHRTRHPCQRLNTFSLSEACKQHPHHSQADSGGLLLCLHFVYLLKHFSLTCVYIKGRYIYFCKSWLLQRCLVFLYKAYTSVLCTALFKRIRFCVVYMGCFLRMGVAF